MRILCIADLHGDREAVDRLSSSLTGKGFDYVFMMGDYSRGFKDAVENNHDVIYMLESFKGYEVRALPGNCDQKDVVDLFAKKGVNFHKTVIKAGGAVLIGLGGSNPTPFGTPFELSEEEIYSSLKDMFESVKGDGRPFVLFTHFPPKDTDCDEIPGKLHVGSTSLRRIIEEYGPKIALCSHIHESGGRQDNIGDTTVYNVGRISDGRALVLEISNEITVKPYVG
ncbi:MAG: metallophosphoesterase [Candidatus Altiarchaeota archaeon]